MAQFDGGKYSKKGVLSYNYLGGEGGAGKGPVSIIKKGDDWFFADKSGKVRKNLPDGGKLNSTHINNLERDGIFKSAKIDPQGNKLSAAKIKAGPDTESFGDSKSITGSSDGIGVDAEGGLAPELAQRGNLRLSGRDAYDPTNAAPSLSSPGEGGSIDYKKTLERRGMAPAPTAASGINPNEATQIAPASGGVTTSNFGGGREMGIGNNTFSGDGSEFEARTGTARLPSEDFDANTVGQGNYGSTFQKYEGAGQMSLGNQNNGNVIAPPQKLAGQNEFTGFGQDRMSGPSFSSPVEAIAPGVDQKNLVVGTGGGTWDVDSDYYMKDGQVMKDSGWFGGDDTVATQADIDAGIKDQASPGMTSAEGWNAAGSVMKGIGGLASAYTGIKNYQLARDAHNTQKNQWQADYNQRLKAYGDNKALINEEIAAKNRILKARGAEESYKSI